MPLMNPNVLSVASTVPSYHADQGKAKEFAYAMFSEAYKDVERLLPVLDNVEIDGRYFSMPPEWIYEFYE